MLYYSHQRFLATVFSRSLVHCEIYAVIHYYIIITYAYNYNILKIHFIALSIIIIIGRLFFFFTLYYAVDKYFEIFLLFSRLAHHNNDIIIFIIILYYSRIVTLKNASITRISCRPSYRIYI